ncbi:MAG: hypothetical protein HYX46_13305 [Betaproteobacteria bacterium]|nr:hypothetical protein [Betaproteobacteria bacterium]
MFVLFTAISVQAREMLLDAEVMEGSPGIELPAFAGNKIRYAIVHHKQQQDQASFAAWLRRHSGARVSFETPDGAAHQAVMHRLDHCFGRGLMLYTDPVQLKAKQVVRLRNQ